MTTPPDKQPAAETLDVSNFKDRAVERQFVLFATAEECAREATPVFLQHKWRWKRRGIPDEAMILESLRNLRSTAEERGRNYVESGRLVYYRQQFGYQRPLGMLVNSIWRKR